MLQTKNNLQISKYKKAFHAQIVIGPGGQGDEKGLSM